MSRTSQRKRQAYEEGHRDGRNRNGLKYSRHPFMEQYRAGYQAGMEKPRPKRTLLEWFRGVFA